MKQKIIAINSPKGGVGKSTIAKELAGIYSKKTWNGNKLKVLLIDLDLEFGSIASLLRIKSPTTILNWTTNIRQKLMDEEERITYSQEFVEENYMYNYADNFKILTAPSRPDELLEIKDNELTILIDNIKNFDYDIVIIDTGNNSCDHTLIALNIADLVLSIVTLDITSVNCTQNFLNLLNTIKVPIDKFSIIVNKLPDNISINSSEVGEIEQTLHKKVLGIVPEYSKIRVINNSGKFSNREVDNFYNSLNKISYDIFPITDIIQEEETLKEEKESFFKKIFRRWLK